MNSKRILQCYRDITKANLEGVTIKTDQSDENFKELVAIISGPVGTPYEHGEFSCILKLTDNFPKDPPSAYFLTKIFHPNVNPTNGEICVNTLKTEWKSTHGFDHILMTIRCLLINPNPESALNEEAGKLLLDDYEEFACRAKLMTSIYAVSQNGRDSSTENRPPIGTSSSTSNNTSQVQEPSSNKSSILQNKKKKSKLKRL